MGFTQLLLDDQWQQSFGPYSPPTAEEERHKSAAVQTFRFDTTSGGIELGCNNLGVLLVIFSLETSRGGWSTLSYVAMETKRNQGMLMLIGWLKTSPSSSRKSRDVAHESFREEVSALSAVVCPSEDTLYETGSRAVFGCLGGCLTLPPPSPGVCVVMALGIRLGPWVSSGCLPNHQSGAGSAMHGCVTYTILHW